MSLYGDDRAVYYDPDEVEPEFQDDDPVPLPDGKRYLNSAEMRELPEGEWVTNGHSQWEAIGFGLFMESETGIQRFAETLANIGVWAGKVG